MSKLHISALIAFMVTLFLTILSFYTTRTKAPKLPSTEKVNLALRQTAHQLYKKKEDHHSTIPPVQQGAPNRYQLKLDQSIDYDYLPYLLNEAFIDFNIEHDYTVVIKNCLSETILLGYNLRAFENKEVTCVGRDLYSDCNILEVIFEASEDTLAGTYFILAIGSLIISLFLAVSAIRLATISEPEVSVEKEVIQIGNFNFTPDKLLLEIDQHPKTLTFREAKLLHYLATHADEILKREDIQQHVWKEEGVIVGRSLDVFISRLRKVLKPDPGVVIKNIHGVGYRLEIKNNGTDD